MDYLDEFETNYAAEFANIESDDALTAEQKSVFKNALTNCDDTESLAQCANKFFHGNKQIGPPVDFSRDQEILGRLNSHTAFVHRIMGELSLSKGDVDELLTSWKSLGVANRLQEIKEIIGRVLMSPFLIWAFRNTETPTKPFEGFVLRDLPCILGLDTSAEDRYIAWGISVPDGVFVTKPTAFDPGLRYLAKWKPGGVTKPNEECAEMYAEGLPEVVVEPVPFETVAEDFLEIMRI